MYKDEKILAIIPARGGSKGLPGKNIKELNGKPLIAWSIEQAKDSKYIDEIIVSTDNKEIADISEKFGVDVPFLRPANFSKDTSPSYEAILYTIDRLEQEGRQFEYVILLEPTSPLRKENDLDNAIERLIDSNKNSLISVGEVHEEHPMIVKKIIDDKVIPYIDEVKKIHQRQQADKAYFPYGVIYMCKIDTYKREKTFYLNDALPYFIERWQNYEIDDIIDFKIIEMIINYIKGDIK